MKMKEKTWLYLLLPPTLLLLSWLFAQCLFYPLLAEGAREGLSFWGKLLWCLLGGLGLGLLAPLAQGFAPPQPKQLLSYALPLAAVLLLAALTNAANAWYRVDVETLPLLLGLGFGPLCLSKRQRKGAFWLWLGLAAILYGLYLAAQACTLPWALNSRYGQAWAGLTIAIRLLQRLGLLAGGFYLLGWPELDTPGRGLAALRWTLYGLYLAWSLLSLLELLLGAQALGGLGGWLSQYPMKDFVGAGLVSVLGGQALCGLWKLAGRRRRA